MSDDNASYIRAAVARDTRFAALQEAIAIGDDMQHNTTVKALLAAFEADATLAMMELAGTAPTDTKAISLISVRVGVHIRVKQILDAIVKRGDLAESILRSQQVHQSDDE